MRFRPAIVSLLTTGSLVGGALVPASAQEPATPDETLVVDVEHDDETFDDCDDEFEETPCSLRDAVITAERLLRTGTRTVEITFAAGVETVVLDSARFGSLDGPWTNDLDLNAPGGSVTIVGAGVTVTSTSGRFLDVADTAPTDDDQLRLLIEGLTVTGGDAALEAGCGNAIASSPPSDETKRDHDFSCGGGALRAAHTAVTLNGASFTDNTVPEVTGFTPWGGAVAIASGSLTTDGTTFTGNLNPSGWGGAVYLGEAPVVDSAPSGPSTATLIDTTFTDNSACEGGAIWLGEGDTLNVRGGLFASNAATMPESVMGSRGGAIYGRGSNVDIRPSETSGTSFEDNRAISGDEARGFGGAIATGIAQPTSQLSVNGASFDSNESVNGGAIAVGSRDVLRINGSEFTDNAATQEGGAVYGDGADLHVNVPVIVIFRTPQPTAPTSTTFTSNSAPVGGAVFLRDSTARIHTASFTANEAVCTDCAQDEGRGGAIHMESAGDGRSLYLERSTFARNLATNGGGGLNLDNEYAGLTNVTFSGNHGAISALHATSADLRNVTFVGNARGDRAAVTGAEASALRFENVLFHETAGADCVGVAIEGGTIHSRGVSCGNVRAPGPLNIQPLAEYGGPTMTHALGAGSTAIDAFQEDDGCADAYVDQRGRRRPVDGDDDDAVRCDAGAYEYQPGDDPVGTPESKPGAGGGGSPAAPANRVPDARDDATFADRDLAVTVDVLGNDTDPDGDPLTVTAVKVAPDNGAAEVVGSIIRYTPANGFTGTDRFTYEVADGRGGTDTAVVTVTVEAPGDLSQACPSGQIEEDGFSDVAEGNVHEFGIDCVAHHGFIDGIDANTFAPARTTTRAQMVSVLAEVTRAAGELPTSSDDAFTDECSTAHEQNVQDMAAAGLVSGFSDGRFGCAVPVNRAQLATLVVRTYGYISGEDVGASGGRRFTDTDGTGHADTIDAAYELGLVLGRTETTFDPGAAVRRDEMASIIARLVDRLVEEGYLSV